VPAATPNAANAGPIRDRKIGSFIYNLLLKHHRMHGNPYLGRVWRTAWKVASDQISGPVSTNIHGQRAIVNFGHTYALYARRFPHWNEPLIELVYQSHSAVKTPIVVIDVGASIGDTVMLLESNCEGMIGAYLCVEGDPEFFSYLRQNLAPLSKASAFGALLSDMEGPIAGLVRTTNLGSASAQGRTLAEATTLDALLADRQLGPGCVLKIDVDGFDGRVLRGARNTLSAYRPAVVFEWHPILCKESGNSPLEHFDVLHGVGYRRFVWFTKYGCFSHFMSGVDDTSIRNLAEVCLNDRHDDNWHYDVVALTDDHGVSDVGLAELSFAKRRRSRY
jgi:FkbM family methyltransferase